MWMGSVELLMPDRRSESNHAGRSKQRSLGQPASAAASLPSGSRSISRRLRDLQLLSWRLRQGETLGLPQLAAALRYERMDRQRLLRAETKPVSNQRFRHRFQPHGTVKSPRKLEIGSRLRLLRADERAANGRPHQRIAQHFERHQIPIAADRNIKQNFKDIEICIEFLVKGPRQRRPELQRKNPLPEEQPNAVHRNLCVRTHLPLPLSLSTADACSVETTNSKFSLLDSDAEGAAGAPQCSPVHSWWTCPSARCAAPSSKSSGGRWDDNHASSATCYPAENLREKGPTCEETAMSSNRKQSLSTILVKDAGQPSKVAYCRLDSDWFIATKQHLQLCHVHCNPGHRPVISYAVLPVQQTVLIGSFRLQLPVQSTADGPAPALNLRLLCGLQAQADGRLPVPVTAAALSLPRSVLELGSCCPGQLDGLFGSAARWTSHRLHCWLSVSIRTAAVGRFSADPACVKALRCGSGPAVFALGLESAACDGVDSVAAAARPCYYAASHCLSLTVRQVAEPSARQLRSHPLDVSWAASSAVSPMIGFGKVVSNSFCGSEADLNSLIEDGCPVQSAGDVGYEVLQSAAMSKPELSGARGDWLNGPGSEQTNNSNDQDFNDNELTRSQENPGCWEYVYIKSDADKSVVLVELHDTQERCSTVSTVLGPMGFNTPVYLAVPAHLLPERALPVVSGNVIELGDWDLNCSEPMEPTAELTAPGFTFFQASVCSNYSEEEEVEFRFAIVVPPQGSDGPNKSELFAWEGGFVRRMSDYMNRGGFLRFGHPDLLADTRDLLEQPAAQQPQPGLVRPGWLTDTDQAMLLLRVQPPILNQDWAQLLRNPMRLDFSAKDVSGATLTPNLRGPFLLQRSSIHHPPSLSSLADLSDQSLQDATYSWISGSSDELENSSNGINSVHLAEAARLRVEFTQQVTLDAPVHCRFQLHFLEGNVSSCVEAVASLPPVKATLSSARVQTFNCAVTLTASSECIGQLSVEVEQIHRYMSGPLDSVRFLDHCGALARPPDPTPVLIKPLPDEWLPHAPLSCSSSEATATPPPWYFEVPIGVSQTGALRLLRSRSGSSRDIKTCAENQEDLSLAFPPEARLVVRAVLDDSAQINAAADALLASVLHVADRCVLLACHDLRLCLTLSFKQSRLSLAFMAASIAEAVAALADCHHFGLHAVVAPTAELLSNEAEGRRLVDAAKARGVALYAYGGGRENAGLTAASDLEGVFGEGTGEESAAF